MANEQEVPALLAEALNKISGSDSGKILVVGGRPSNFTDFESLNESGRVTFWLGEESSKKRAIPPGVLVVILTMWRAPHIMDVVRAWRDETGGIFVEVGNSTGILNKSFFAPLLQRWGMTGEGTEGPESEEESPPLTFQDLGVELDTIGGLVSDAVVRFKLRVDAVVEATQKRVEVELRPRLEEEIRARVHGELASRVATAREEGRGEIAGQVVDLQARLAAAESSNNDLRQQVTKLTNDLAAEVNRRTAAEKKFAAAKKAILDA